MISLKSLKKRNELKIKLIFFNNGRLSLDIHSPLSLLHQQSKAAIPIHATKDMAVTTLNAISVVE